MAADSAFDLSAVLKIDTRKIESGLKAAAGQVNNFQRALNSLGASQERGGLGNVVRLIAAIGELSKKSFGGESLSALNGYKRGVDALNKSLATTLKLQKDANAAQAKQFGAGGGSGAGLGGVAKRAADALKSVGELTKRTFGLDGVGAANAYGSAVSKINQQLATTLRLTRAIGAAPLSAGGPGAAAGASRAIPLALPMTLPLAVGQGMAGGGHFAGATASLAGIAAAASQQMQKLQAAGAQAAARIRAGFDRAKQSVAGVGLAATVAGGKLISLASDANEAGSKFEFVFQEASGKTGKALDDFAKAAGRSRYALRSTAADIGALIQPMGFTREKTGELSTAVSKLAVDLSSFFNVSENDALIALKAGIVGESEPLRRLGVNLNEVKIQQEAFRLGLAKSKNEVQGAAKAQAILSLILKETSQAQGDAIRTAFQFANSYRRTRDFIKDAATDLGQALIPAATKYIRVIGDAAQPVAKWAKENQKLLEQRVDQYVLRAEAAVGKLRDAFVRIYQALGPVRNSLGGVRDTLQDVYGRGRELFDSLPRWAQDALLVGGALTGISMGLGAIGGSIPILGPFIGSFSMLLNPVGLLKGLFSTLMPLLTTFASVGGSLVAGVFSPWGVAIAAVVAVFGGLVISIRKALETSQTAQESWESIRATFIRIGDKVREFIDGGLKVLADWWEKNREQIEQIEEKVGELALTIGEKLAAALEYVADKALPLLKDGLSKLGEVASALLEGFEAIVDVFNGDWSRAMLLGNSLVIEFNKSLISMLELLIQVPQKLGGFLGAAVAGGMQDKINSLKMENALRESSQDMLADQVTRGDQERDAKRAKRRSAQTGSALADALGAGFGVASGAINEKAIIAKRKIQDQADLDFKKANASTVAQADTSVAKAQAADAGAYDVDVRGGTIGGGVPVKAPASAQQQHDQAAIDAAMQSQVEDSIAGFMPLAAKRMQGAGNLPMTGGGKTIGQANKMLAQSMQRNAASNRSAMQGLRQSAGGDQSARQDVGGIGQLFAASMQTAAMAMQTEGEERQKLLVTSEQQRQAALAMTKAFQDGQRGAKGLGDAAKQAGVDMDKLDEAAQQKLAHAKGQLTPAEHQQQQQAQQAMQQFGQQVQQAWQQGMQQMGQQAWDSGQAMLSQAMGGPAQVQQMIDQATASGDMKSAVGLMRTRLQAALSAAQLNLHNLASDTLGGGGLGSSHGGVANDAYFASLDSPLANLIRFLQSQLASLPKMAAGGVVTSATNLIAGERGPEAILPLTSFGNMLGALPVFTGIQSAMEKIGDFFSLWGNNQALAGQYFSNLTKFQDAFDYTMGRMYDARRIDFTPQGMTQSYSGGAAAENGARIGMTGAMAFHGPINMTFNGLNPLNQAHARIIAQGIFGELSAYSRSLGYGMMGAGMLSGGGSVQAAGPMPGGGGYTFTGRGYGYAR